MIIMHYNYSTKIKEMHLVHKSDISGFIDNSDLDKKVATLAAKQI